ncbi:hypothetical protein LB518_05905, partial [Mesorhizobium sp. BR1-1-16]|uniref:hypothetical protein n=1 Tax=Mesorhizobium sp. BR1-1-16 TaxID=2876653 RepID=UPI001CCB7C77
MEGLRRWQFVDELNVFQIALLLAGHDPAPLERVAYSVFGDEIIDAAAPFLTSLKNAIRAERLDTIVRPWNQSDDEIDWSNTLVDVAELRVWLARKGMHDTFFRAPASRATSALAIDDTSSAFHSPKLAAAVAAWTAVANDPTRRRGKSAKQAIIAWLTENAGSYGLTNRDGSPNKLGIEEIAKVANWQPNGGAPKTPSVLPEPSPLLAQTPDKVRPKP